MLASFTTQAEQVIQEDNKLEAFNIKLYCKRLMEQAAQLISPSMSLLHT